MKQKKKNIISFILLLFFPFILFADAQSLNEQCEKGNGKACMDLATYYRSGSIYYDIKKNESKAKYYYDKYSELANAKSNTFEDLIKQCNDGIFDVCRNIAYSYRDGKGVVKNKEKEIEYYIKACKLGDRFICKKVPITKEKNDYISIAMSLGARSGQDGYIMLEKMCAVDNPFACHYLYGQHYRKNTKKDRLLAKQYFEKTYILMEESCAKNTAKSCEWLWHDYAKNDKKKEGETYLQQAINLYKIDCDNNIKGSCLGYHSLLKQQN